MYIVFLRHNVIAYDGLQYYINKIFICTGKQKTLYDSLYYNICFIAVVWNWIYNISVVSINIYVPVCDLKSQDCQGD